MLHRVCVALKTLGHDKQRRISHTWSWWTFPEEKLGGQNPYLPDPGKERAGFYNQESSEQSKEEATWLQQDETSKWPEMTEN